MRCRYIGFVFLAAFVYLKSQRDVTIEIHTYVYIDTTNNITIQNLNKQFCDMYECMHIVIYNFLYCFKKV